MDKNTRRRSSLLLAITLGLLLIFTLTACGTNGPTTTGSSGTTNATPTASPTQTNPATTGCPNSTAVTTTPPPANVVLKNTTTTPTVAKKGDIIEIDLVQGHTWQLTSNSFTILNMQNPAGYAFTKTNDCVWRFTATGTGQAQISFIGRPICKKGQLCPMYILNASFSITVQ